MDTKHTKGPWTRSGREGDHVYIYHSDDRGGAASLVVAKVTCRDAWEPEQMANAHLIAAAPDLLEALREIHNIAAAPRLPENVNEDWPTVLMRRLGEVRNVSRKAIAKAEGK